MRKGIIGRKLGMTQIFGEDGNVIPVTVIEAGPCAVVQIKTKEKEGYNALQFGFLKKKPQRVNKPLTGHQQKSNAGPFYVLQEFRVDEVGSIPWGRRLRSRPLPSGTASISRVPARARDCRGHQAARLSRLSGIARDA